MMDGYSATIERVEYPFIFRQKVRRGFWGGGGDTGTIWVF